jgi:hypothetical protein
MSSARKGVAGPFEFKRVVKWRISLLFVSWRITDVKTGKLADVAQKTTPSPVSTERLGKTLEESTSPLVTPGVTLIFVRQMGH